MPMLPVSASELAQIQADAVSAVCDQPCQIFYKTTTRGIAGEPLASYNSTPDVTTVAGISEPTATHLENYGYIIGSLAAWQVKLPVSTIVHEQDRMVISGQLLEVYVILAPRSYEALRTVLVAEVK